LRAALTGRAQFFISSLGFPPFQAERAMNADAALLA
jgi:hypothetical protein